MNKRGQALVEFIIILPLIIIVMLAIIDYGSISFNKNKMEGLINDIDRMYTNSESIDEIKNFVSKNDSDIDISFVDDDKYTKIILKKNFKYITPGIESILKNNEIKVERVIYHE